MHFADDQITGVVNFDYDVLDQTHPTRITPDHYFWQGQAAVLEELLRWLTVPKTDSGISARVRALCLYLHPSLIDATSLSQISKRKGAPTRAALSKALLRMQEKFGMSPGYYQKIGSLREKFSRSAKVGHQNRKSNGSRSQKNSQKLSG